MEEEKVMGPASLGLELGVPKSNPMLNSVVLQNLFKIVPIEDLKNMRGVCKLWWELSLPVIRSSSQIRIKASKRGRTIHKYEDYLALISTTEDDKFGFLRHPFEDFYFGWGNEGEVLKFCTRFGSQIKRLKLDGCGFRRIDFRKIIFELLPNLESFVCEYTHCLEDKVWQEFDREEVGVTACPAQPVETMKSLVIDLGMSYETFQLPFSWVEIFQKYPALTALGLHDIESTSNSDSNTEFEKVLLAMKTVSENTGRKWKIEKLDIMRIEMDDELSTPFTPVVLDYLRQLQFPLRSLTLDVDWHNKEVSEFFDMYSAALQELTLYSLWSDFVFLSTISFDYLSKLHLIGDVPNLYFLRSTPNLKTLWIANEIDGVRVEVLPWDYICKPFQSKGMEEHFRSPCNKFEDEGKFSIGDETVSTVQNTNFTELDGFVLQSLEELVVERELCSSDDLWALMKLMPNLTRLGIGLDNDGFRIVCYNLKGLTALDIKPSRVDQHAITGKVDGLDVHLPNNITDLKNLRFFGIGKALSSAAILSEDVVKNGLLQLSRLDDISVYCSRDMSEETFTQLCQKYPKSYIRRSDIL